MSTNVPMIRRIGLVAGLCGSVVAAGWAQPRAEAPWRVELRDFGRAGSAGAEWSAWAPREEIAPHCTVDPAHFRSAPDALAIAGGGDAAEYGGWITTVGGIRGGKHYRLTAFYRTEAVADPRRQVLALLDWRDRSGARTAQPDYAFEEAPAGDWTRVTLTVPAPAEAAAVRIELLLGWSPRGTVWWDDIALEEVPPPPPRWVRLGTVSLHLHENEDRLGLCLQALDAIARDRPDIVCLGEELLVQGTARPYASVAEPIPGPSTQRLGEAARKHHLYIVAGLTERDGRRVYNTAVLIDRQGNLAGKYRKVYLPREEIEGGMTPGDAYAVFTTDFGRIGIMICWDAEYVDGARAMALQGAEVLLVPAAGGDLTLLRARALENHVYLVSSGYDVESAIVDPTGKVLFATLKSGVNQVIAVNLADRFTDPWLGDMRPRFHKEVRGDIDMPGLNRR